MELSSFTRILDILTKTFTLNPRVLLNRMEVEAIASQNPFCSSGCGIPSPTNLSSQLQSVSLFLIGAF